MLQLHIDTEGAAFEDEGFYEETARILEKAAEMIRNGQTAGSLPDMNGNRAGSFTLGIDGRNFVES